MVIPCNWKTKQNKKKTLVIFRKPFSEDSCLKSLRSYQGDICWLGRVLGVKEVRRRTKQLSGPHLTWPKGLHPENQIQRAPSSVISWIPNTQCPLSHAPASNTSQLTLSTPCHPSPAVPLGEKHYLPSFKCSFVLKLFF